MSISPCFKELQLPVAQTAIVREILKEQVPGAQVFAFGSRVNGKPAKYADLDLAVSLSRPLPLRTLRMLKDAFEDSDLPVCVDVVDWSQADEQFKTSVLASGIAPLQPAGGLGSSHFPVG